jgi:hypothetical protein
MIIMILVGGYIRAGKKTEMVMAWWLEGSQLTVHHVLPNAICLIYAYMS